MMTFTSVVDDGDDVFHQEARMLLQPEEQGEGGMLRWGGVKPPFQDDDNDVVDGRFGLI